MTVSKKSRTILRTAFVTFIILIMSTVAVYFMGVAYSAMEYKAYGKEVSFFEITEKNFTFFGKTFDLDFKLAGKHIKKVAEFFSGGIIKLLAIVKNGYGELSRLIGMSK